MAGTRRSGFPERVGIFSSPVGRSFHGRVYLGAPKALLVELGEYAGRVLSSYLLEKCVLVLGERDRRVAVLDQILLAGSVGRIPQLADLGDARPRRIID